MKKRGRVVPSPRFPSRSSLNRSISLHSNVPLSFPESDPPQWTELGADIDEFYDAQEFMEVIPPRQNSAAKVRVASKTLLQAFDDTTLKVERKVPEVKLRKKTVPNAYRVLTGDALNLASCVTPNLAADELALSDVKVLHLGVTLPQRWSLRKVPCFPRAPFVASSALFPPKIQMRRVENRKRNEKS